MKILEKHHRYVFSIYLPTFLIALALILFFPTQVALCFRIHWFFLIALLCLAFTPFGKIRLGDQIKIKLTHWALLIFITQASIILAWRGMAFIVTQGLPLQSPLNTAQLLTLTQKTFIWQNGLFPSAIYLLIGISLAYIGFYQKKPGKLSLTLMPLLKNKIEGAISLTTDFITRIVLIFSIASCISIGILLALTLCSHLFNIPINLGLKFPALLIATLLLIVINTKQWKTSISYFVSKNIPHALIAILFICTATAALLFLNIVSQTIAVNVSQWNNVLIHYNIPHWQQHWQVLSGLWLLLWAPLFGGLIAYLSQGYQIRTIILTGLLLVVLANTLWYIPSNSFLNYTLPSIGILFLLVLFLQKKYLIYQIRAVVPETHHEKPRSLHAHTHSLFIITTFLLALYLPLGIFVLNVALFAALLLAVILILISTLAVFFMIKKGR